MIKADIVKNSDDMAKLLQPLRPQGPFIIVPNWHCTQEGYGTDAQTLAYLLEVLPGEKIVVEAYDAARTDDMERFHSMDMQEAHEHLEYFRQQDQLFLESTGNGEVLAKYGAEYVNVTEEAWAGRLVDADQVKALVEDRYGPILHQELYGIVPNRLWQYRHGTLINCAKIKASIFAGGVFFGLAMKNLFGLIPIPNRIGYHGSEHRGLSRSIVDVYQVYRSTFRVISVLEAIHASLITARGTLEDSFALVKNLSFAAASDNAVELDAFMVQALGGSPDERNFLKMGADIFGRWDPNTFPAVPPTVADRFGEIMSTTTDD